MKVSNLQLLERPELEGFELDIDRWITHVGAFTIILDQDFDQTEWRTVVFYGPAYKQYTGLESKEEARDYALELASTIADKTATRLNNMLSKVRER